MAALWALALALALLLAPPARAQAPADPGCGARVLAIEAARAGADGARPATGWTAVTLPDHWETRWPGHGGTVWYRIDWTPACPAGSAGDVGLLVESINTAGEILLNEDRLWRDASLAEPLSRSWNMPRYWRVPPALQRPGRNTVWIRVVGVAGQSPGLGPVMLGEPQALRQRHASLRWHNRTLYVVNLCVSAVLGTLFFCIWVIRRDQRAYGWYALTALFWVLFVANVLATSPWPLPDTLAAARANAAVLALYLACFCVFTWRFAERVFARLERALWLLTGMLVAALLLVPDAWLPAVQWATVMGVAAAFLANCLLWPWLTWRTRRAEHRLLAGCLLVFLVACVHDVLYISGVRLLGASLTPYASLVGMVCLSAVLGLRHARSVRRIERYNQDLADGIARAGAELSTTLAREHALALSNTRLRERLELAHDLHDGLGGSLVRMMAMVEQAQAPLPNRQFLSMLKLLRDDLRQTIDSGTSSGVQVPATPHEWAAPLRHRYMQLFDELDVACRWTLPPHWRPAPTALQCLALQRVVEESLTNVIKHSRARHVRVSLALHEGSSLRLEIEDDGIGFDVDAVRTANLSVGVRSMHDRVARVGGTLALRSAPGATCVCVTLPLAPANTQFQ